MVQKIVMYLGCVLVFLATITHCKGASAYDPSTVINVYPSLQKIKNGGAASRSSQDYGRDSGNYDEYGEEPCMTTGSCGAASNVKPTWIPNDDENDFKKDEPESTPSTELPDQNMYEDSEMFKPAIKRSHMKEEPNAAFPTMEKNQKRSLLSKLHGESPSKFRLHDNPESHWLKQHKWGSFHDMLQLLRNRKH